MAIGEHFRPPGYGPIGLAPSNDFLWGRLVTGVFAVAISLSMSWPAGQAPVELARTAAPQPKHEQIARLDARHRQEPEIMDATALHETWTPPDEPRQGAPRAAQGTPESPKRLRLQRTTAQAKAKSGAVAQRKPGVKPHTLAHQVARAKLTRTRDHVRREYLAAREQVAALTGEDSGSAYLARRAARRQSVMRTHVADHSHRRSQAGRGALARS